ncbi:MAG: ACT domain-containing protein, partial [Candidatus Microthrix subdominans]
MADTPTPAYSLRIRVRMENRPGMLGRLAMAIGEVGANIAALDGFEVKTSHLVQNAVVYCSGEAHQKEVLEAVNAIDGIVVLEWSDQVFDLHEGGKIELRSLSELRDIDDLSMAYTPGVARVCMEISKNPMRAHDLTIKANTVAIVSDGTAVLGLG